MVDRLLDIITGGEHSKTVNKLKQVNFHYFSCVLLDFFKFLSSESKMDLKLRKLKICGYHNIDE